MAKGNEGDKADKTIETDTLVATFHQAHGLIPNDQELLKIEPHMRVADALKLMQKHHYSQLPVVVGNAVLGVFSYRSFGEKALAKQKANKSEWLGELPVEDFLEQYEFVHGSQDWNRIVDYLNRDDAFFVGHLNSLDGLVTTMDVLNYFREVANPFIILAEVELTLRKMIQTSITEEKWREALEVSLATAYEGKKVPMDLSDMTFDNYVQIISNSDNWHYFEAFFAPGDASRKQTTRKLQQLRDWRNIVFHIKQRLEPWELQTLSEHRAWLQLRMRAFEAKRNQESSSKSPENTKRGEMNRQKLLENSTPAAAQFFEWLLREAEVRARYYAIMWHPVSFSIRLRKERGSSGVAFGYAPDNLDIYFGSLDLPSSILAGLRLDLLASGTFTEAGKHTLKAQVSQVNEMALQDATRYLLDRLVMVSQPQ